MKKVAILTDLLRFDEGYSVARGVRNNLKMLTRAGYVPLLLMRKGKPPDDFFGFQTHELDYGRPGTNRVEVTDGSGRIIDGLHQQLKEALDGYDVVLTHDLIYQANLWEAHVAARRLAKERPNMRWLHWVHSVGNLRTKDKTGPFKDELKGPFPNSTLITMSEDTAPIMARQLGYKNVAVVPHPVDFTEDFHPCSKIIVDKADLLSADIIAVYPCRLDRGKRPHVVIDVLAELRRKGFDARGVFVDFHSTAGDKVTYRNEMLEQANKLGVPVFFVSQMIDDLWNAGAEYHNDFVYSIPHKAVLDLFEVADVLIQPSVSESYSRIVVEAAWKRCCLVLNMGIPAFRQYDGYVMVLSDRTTTDIAQMMRANPVLCLHSKIRKERNLKAIWEDRLHPLIEGES